MAALGRVLQTGDLDGSLNMAIDEMLWEAAAAGMPYLRLYGWSNRPCFSLGYFQSGDEIRCVPEWRGLSFVRRMTGGGAIVHDGDLTFSLALPTVLARRDPDDLYDRLHRAIAAELRSSGIPAVVEDSPVPSSKSDRLCFLRHDPFAVRVHQSKILGSAQRRRPASVLVQGSLLLTTSIVAPEIPGLQELIGHPVDRRLLDEAIVRAIQAAFRLDLHPVELSPDFRSQAAELAHEKYRSPAWNERR
ncbi:MAG: lipoate--protein ligase family protein [Planctomycetes bacterium]|nr:lipoate--protein ligase family protein [Planctomycetota bacterium]